MRIATDLSRRQVAAWLAAGAVLAAAPASAVSSEELPLADRLAAYAHALRLADLDPATVETVKVRLIDTRGCGLAALDAGPVRICRKVALSDGARAASVPGTDRRSSPELAAFANGVAIRHEDFNDVYGWARDRETGR